MAIMVPENITVKWDREAEAELAKTAREWIEHGERAEGLHASDLLDPRQAYWKMKDPQALPDRLITTFLVGKVLHAFVLQEGKDRDISNQDEGSQWSEELQIWYSPDKFRMRKARDGSDVKVVAELKTSRGKEPQCVEDIQMYLEQLMIYMAAEKIRFFELYVLYLNARDDEGRTFPKFRCVKGSVTSQGLEAVTKDIKTQVQVLQAAIKTGNHRALPLCREWKCSPDMCDWWKKCKPEGRYDSPTYLKPKRRR